jgi:transcriptional regulator with XRE-family HTH domain
MDLGSAIREARRGCGLSQVRLAELIGCSRDAVLAVERGGGSVAVFERAATTVNFRITGLADGGTIGNQLKAARHRRGLSQAAVALRANLSVPTVRSLEQGGGNVRSLSAVLNVLAPRARPNAVFKAHYQIRKDVRFTPPEFLEEVIRSFGPISIDVAGDDRSYVVADRILTEREDGLVTKWSGQLAWCNPPFSSLSRWINRCADAWEGREVESIVALYPARTETIAFRTRVLGKADVLLLPRRLCFHDENRVRLAPSPFALMLIAWGQPRSAVQNYAKGVGAHVIWGDPV